MPIGSDQLWFTGLLPVDMDHGEEVAGNTAYSRTVNGSHYELVNTPDNVTVYQEGRVHIQGPGGFGWSRTARTIGGRDRHERAYH